MKKFWSVILVVITIFSVVPFTTFAAESNTQKVCEDVADETQGNDTNETQSSEDTSQSSENSSVNESQESETTEVASSESTSTEPSEETSNTDESSSETEPVESTAENESASSDATEPSSETEPTEATTKVVKPTKVKGFKVSKKSTTYVKLVWNSYEGNANRFFIYRADEKSNGKFSDFSLIKNMGNTARVSYVDATVEAGKVYIYKIVPCKYSKKNPLYGKESRYKVFVPLKKSSSLNVTKASTNKIVIKWAKINNATKYEIFRKTASGSYKKIKSTKETTFTDLNITSGVSYTYAVRGLRVAINKLRYSPFVFVQTASNVTTVKGLKVKSYMQKALLSWDEVSGADGYAIYKEKSNGKYQYLGSTTYTNYLTNRLAVGKNYKLQVRAYKIVNGNKVYGKTKSIKVNIVAGAYGKTASGTYIEVCTETQQMLMYVNDKLYAKTPVVTGFYNVYDTTKGFHYVLNKKENARLKGSAGNDTWDVMVNYWVAFTYDGQGIHDSTWRYSGYGGEIYKRDGSHGCVNTPLESMKKIYAKTYVGMPIIVY